MQDAKEKAMMTERPLLKKIILFTLPLIATSILQLLYNAADIVVVGQFSGSTAMAAVGSTTSLVNLITNLFIGLSVGTLSVMSRSVGANDYEYSKKVTHTSIIISVICGVFVGAVGFAFCEFFLVLMQSPTDVLPQSALYLRICFFGSPFLMIYNFGAALLRACGDTKRPLIILALSGLLNVGINYALVAGFALGVIGVAVGTIVSQAASAVAVMAVLAKNKGFCKFSLKNLRIDLPALKEIIKIGLPAGLQSTIFSISNVVIQSSINSFGDIAMAGSAAASSIEGFVYATMNSVSQACLTFVACNLGAKKSQNMRITVYESLILVALIGLVFGIGVYLLGRPLISIYNNKEEVIKYGLERLSVIAVTYALCGVMDVLVSGMRGVGYSVVPAITTVAGVCGLRLLWVYTVFANYRSLFVLYLSYPISWAVTTLVHLVSYFVVRAKVEKSIKNENLVEIQ